jgi:effector-binding domain-containing protein
VKTLIVVALILIILSVVGWKTSRFGYESASYTVVEKDGAFEIRDYPDLTLVSTTGSGPEGDDAFMRLFRYIAKNNEEEQKIAMTTPVFMTSGENAKMSFVVPEDVAASGAPEPKSSDVELATESMGKVAVYRYSGKWKERLRKQAREKLAEWIKDKGLTTSGEYFNAGYDPPFTPGFLKRNEALVRLAE